MSGDISEYACTICGLPSTWRSMGGPGICPSCDCGHFRDGRKWSYGDVMLCLKDSTLEQKTEFQKRAADASRSGMAPAAEAGSREPTKMAKCLHCGGSYAIASSPFNDGFAAGWRAGSRDTERLDVAQESIEYLESCYRLNSFPQPHGMPGGVSIPNATHLRALLDAVIHQRDGTKS